MTFKKSIQRTIASVSCFAFLLSVCLGPNFVQAQAQSKTIKQSVQDSLLMATIYERSVRSYKKHNNPNEFLWGIKHLIETDVDAALSLALAHTSEVLPTVDVNQSSGLITITHRDSRKIEIMPIDMAAGKFEINKKSFTWNLDDTFETNVKKIQSLVGGEDYSFIWNFLISSAHAGEKGGLDDDERLRNPHFLSDGKDKAEEESPRSYRPFRNGKSTAQKRPHSLRTSGEKADARETAKKKCTDENGKRKKSCSIWMWIGIGLGIALTGLLIYKLTKKNDKKSSLPSGNSDTPWIDAADGLNDPVYPGYESSGGGTTPIHGGTVDPSSVVIPDGVELVE